MAKVGKITVHIPGHERADYSLYYSQKNNFHIRGIPDDFKKLTEFMPDGYETEAVLRETLRCAIETAKEKLKSKRKVIIFIISASAELGMNKTGPGQFQGYKKGISDSIGFTGYGSNGAVLSVEYQTLFEISDGVKKEYYKINDNDSIGFRANFSSHQSTIIDWTQEREDFFRSIYKSMSGLLLKLSGFFFSRDIDTVLKAIDSKQLILDK